METSFKDRAFQLWESKVSHGSLLIRSPKAPSVSENIDLVCVGVEYLAAPRHMKGLDLVEATPEEIKNFDNGRDGDGGDDAHTTSKTGVENVTS